MIPPHLPPPTCDIQKHRQWQRIKILVTATFFGLVAGISGAAVMLGWIWPGFGEGEVFSSTHYSLPNYHTQLESRVRQEMDERVVAVYTGSETNRGIKYLPRQNFLGNGLLVSSDGWFVIYPGNYSGNYRNWQAVLSDGAIYGVATVLPDKISGLVFARLDLTQSATLGRAGLQFKVASFVDNLDLGVDLFVFNGLNWQSASEVEEITRPFVSAHLDSAPLKLMSLSSNFLAGAVVVNSQGRAVGLTIGGQEFLPYQYITRLLPGVLDQQKIIYASLGVEGWYSAEQPLIDAGEKIDGFFVTKGAGVLRAGDIILELNGQVMNNDNLWLGLKVGDGVRLKVRRAGVDIDLESTMVGR
ncbi:MAG: hypothetical protein A2538_02150 [Candidatus Magasanikbacteria bacterium RIFOXYD2_FULL_41_14]|uniref:PDZ domain-containing protein n=1 Tax=Candidatus Magasanikbacteria bacterium RIFOXYD2_FULL_41_14 TaxID=1798709 RepID=A0A1F6PD47_9BACT|nr:MAG: hypothetical protein A2538_02150 [Candidatus Magasanikbacteria bacterium RIFOXYD2_FULL_41_14]